MLLCSMQALAELAVLYPVNGAFYTYVVRFIDPSWGFAVGWDYTLAWLFVLPFELISAGVAIDFWNTGISPAVWTTAILAALVCIQALGVRGYGEVEFVLSMVKVCAVVGFIIFGIVVDCGGVGGRGYLGARYWRDPGAFRNGLNGFAGVFTVASFSMGGTELVGLAAAESADPRGAVPAAARQVFARIALFYVLSVFVLGLVLPSNDPRLAAASGNDSRASPFVLAIQDAGVAALPSVFNGVIAASAVSVANSCTYGSTRTLQALAGRGMAPRRLARVDAAGRPRWCVALALGVGLLGYVGAASPGGGEEAFSWLLSLSGLSYFFVWGSVCAAHIRFRLAWARQGFAPERIPWRAPMGVWGSAVGLALTGLCLVATFYVALWPSPDASPDPRVFFQQYLAAPIVLALYAGRKVAMRDWRPWVRLSEMDLTSGARLSSIALEQVPPSLPQPPGPQPQPYQQPQPQPQPQSQLRQQELEEGNSDRDGNGNSNSSGSSNQWTAGDGLIGRCGLSGRYCERPASPDPLPPAPFHLETLRVSHSNIGPQTLAEPMRSAHPELGSPALHDFDFDYDY